MIRLYGVPFSAHTRKVILALYEKQLSFELVPVIPLTPPEGWRQISPLGLIPALQIEGLTLCDSTVICTYLDKICPQHPVYPEEAVAYARTLWLEEFVDGSLARDILHGVLLPRVFAPKFLNIPTDEALVNDSLHNQIPEKLDYLESCVQGEFLVDSGFSMADITVASILMNLAYAGEGISAENYPALHGYLKQLLQRECFQRAFAVELEAVKEVPELELGFLADMGVIRTEEAACSA